MKCYKAVKIFVIAEWSEWQQILRLVLDNLAVYVVECETMSHDRIVGRLHAPKMEAFFSAARSRYTMENFHFPGGI